MTIELQAKRWVLDGTVHLVTVTAMAMLLWRHAYWRDSTNLWLIASGAGSIGELIERFSSENRPLLWIFLVWTCSRLSDDIDVLKLISIICSQISVTMVLYLLPIKKIWRHAFVLGFIPLIGYPVISEDYSFGLMVFLIALVGLTREWDIRIQFVILSLLANSHFLFLLLSLPLAVIAIFFFRGSVRRNWERAFVRRVAISGTLFGLSLGMSLWFILPSENNPFRPDPVLDPLNNLRDGIDSVTMAIVPSLWSFQESRIVNVFTTVLVLLFVLASLVALSMRSMGTVIVFSAAALLLIANMVFGYGEYWWHLGTIFLCFFACFAVCEKFEIDDSLNGRRIQQSFNFLFSLLLICQVVAVPMGPGRDFLTSQPYSNARNAAQVINDYCIETCTVIGSDSQTGVGVVAFLDVPRVYWVDRRQFGTYTEWETLTFESGSWDNWINLMNSFKNPIFFTSPKESFPSEVRLLARLEGAIWSDEDFDIFVLSS